MGDPLYVQKGFGLKAQIKDLLQNDYHSHVVDALRERGFRITLADVELRLAKEFGFCYGVDRAVDLAYETRRHFPQKIIYITTEIIHNPYVNKRLVELGVRFLDGDDGYSLDDVTADDVVILPAFGVETTQLAALKQKGCVLVDTTCGSVMNVWRRVKQYARDGLTSVIHGKYAHEETKATASQAVELGGHYLVVRDKGEAEVVCDTITRGPKALAKDAFVAKFKNAMSPGFDPERHLERVGVANQTTMLSTESLEIAAMLGKAMAARHGEAATADRVRSFDTICSATQDRQDAILDMGKDGDLDIVVVIGGYNSSNTTHLAAMAGRFAPSFHIDGPDEIVSLERIRHQPYGSKERVTAEGWLPAGRVVVGITAGASTPNRTVGEVVTRILELRGIPHDELTAGAPVKQATKGEPLPLV
jgi:4-hydroxy-3-methylbut-2-en-1-yl diphosphate reductase